MQFFVLFIFTNKTKMSVMLVLEERQGVGKCRCYFAKSPRGVQLVLLESKRDAGQ